MVQNLIGNNETNPNKLIVENGVGKSGMTRQIRGIRVGKEMKKI